MGALNAFMNKPRILLAENDHSHRLLIKSILGRDRYTFVEVVNGLQAVEAFSEEDFDLVMLDVDLPVLNSFDAMVRIRKIKREFNVPILLVAAKGGNSDEIARGLRSGADDFIAEPFRAEELRARVEAFCRLSSTQREKIQQQKELAKFDLFKQMVTTVSHHISNAVHIIILSCQSQQRHPGDEDNVRRMINDIKKQSRRITAVVKSLEEIAEHTTIKTTAKFPGSDERMIDIIETWKDIIGGT